MTIQGYTSCTTPWLHSDNRNRTWTGRCLSSWSPNIHCSSKNNRGSDVHNRWNYTRP